jgi:hypothetical protein
MIIVVEAALPPTRTLPTTSWGEGVPGAGPSTPLSADDPRNKSEDHESDLSRKGRDGAPYSLLAIRHSAPAQNLKFTFPLTALSMARWPYCPEYETPTVNIEVSA